MVSEQLKMLAKVVFDGGAVTTFGALAFTNTVTGPAQIGAYAMMGASAVLFLCHVAKLTDLGNVAKSFIGWRGA